jgi:ribosome biogenesis protein SSF1/2
MHVASLFNVTNVLMLTATERAPYLRIVKAPQGPTLTFRVAAYSLMGDIARVADAVRTRPPSRFTPRRSSS